MKSYDILRGESDKSIPESVDIISRWLAREINISCKKDDTTKGTDLIFQQNKLRVAHRSRKYDIYPIRDVTIKYKSRFGDHIPTEYEKLRDMQLEPDTKFWYFYCQFDQEQNTIKRYILYDLAMLIKTDEFKNSDEIFTKIQLNRIDGGSHFGIISINKLKEIGCIIDFNNEYNSNYQHKINEIINFTL